MKNESIRSNREGKRISHTPKVESFLLEPADDVSNLQNRKSKFPIKNHAKRYKKLPKQLKISQTNTNQLRYLTDPKPQNSSRKSMAKTTRRTLKEKKKSDYQASLDAVRLDHDEGLLHLSKEPIWSNKPINERKKKKKSRSGGDEEDAERRGVEARRSGSWKRRGGYLYIWCDVLRCRAPIGIILEIFATWKRTAAASFWAVGLAVFHFCLFLFFFSLHYRWRFWFWFARFGRDLRESESGRGFAAETSGWWETETCVQRKNAVTVEVHARVSCRADWAV